MSAWPIMRRFFLYGLTSSFGKELGIVSGPLPRECRELRSFGAGFSADPSMGFLRHCKSERHVNKVCNVFDVGFALSEEHPYFNDKAAYN